MRERGRTEPIELVNAMTAYRFEAGVSEHSSFSKLEGSAGHERRISRVEEYPRRKTEGLYNPVTKNAPRTIRNASGVIEEAILRIILLQRSDAVDSFETSVPGPDTRIFLNSYNLSTCRARSGHIIIQKSTRLYKVTATRMRFTAGRIDCCSEAASVRWFRATLGRSDRQSR